MRLAKHPKGDWCHLCGSRKNPLFDIFYDENAENRTGKEKYLRICKDCSDIINRGFNK